MSNICSECGTACVFKESKCELFGYPCDACRTVLCKNCAGLTATEIRFVLLSTRVVPYLCKRCVRSLKQLPVLEKRVEELEQEIQELKGAVKSSKQSYADILKSSKDQSNLFENNIKKLEEKVEVIASVENIPVANSLSYLEPTIHELREREQRETNILIFGVKEPAKANREERIACEKTVVTNILKKVDETVTEEITITRLGKYEEQKVRPIKVSFPNKSDALNILRQKKKLDNYDNIYIKADLTVSQRKYLHLILSELETRTKAGETDLRVRYVNSVPKIVKVKSAVDKKN